MFHLYAAIRVTYRGDDEPFYAFQPYLAPQTGKCSEGCHIRFVGTPHLSHRQPSGLQFKVQQDLRLLAKAQQLLYSGQRMK